MSQLGEPKASAPTPDWMAKGDLLPWSWAEERLEKEMSYWLVTVRANGFPEARPVWGVWWGTYGLFLSVGHGGLQRTEPTRSTPITVHLDNAVEAVILEGTIDRLATPQSSQRSRRPTIEIDRDVRKEATEKYNKKYEWDFDVEGSDLNFFFRPKVAYGWSYASGWTGDSHGTKWVFE